MDRLICFCLLGVLAVSTQADVNISIEAGLSNYSFLTLGQDTERNQVRSGALLVDHKVEADTLGHIAPSLGVTIDFNINSQASLDLSAWYLGEPDLKTSSVYQVSDGGFQTKEGQIHNHFSSIALVGSYRISKLLDNTFVNLGYAHFFERHDGGAIRSDIINGQIRDLEVEEVQYRNDEGHLTFGLTTQVKWVNRSDLQFRWQHLQSMYGPVELFTLGLVY